MIEPRPIVLEYRGIRLEPLAQEHMFAAAPGASA